MSSATILRADRANVLDWLKVIGVVPVVRQAILVMHPRLQIEQTKAVHAEFQRVWETWKHIYRAAVADLTRLSQDNLRIVEREQVRYKIDGKTPMIDLPRLQTVGAEMPWDLRNCLALCVEDDYSSKVWTRVGPAIENSHRAFPLESMLPVIERFREVTAACGEWFFGQFGDLTKNMFEGQRGATLEITTLGLQVQGSYSEDDIESWLLTSDVDGAEGPNFGNEELCDYLRSAANLKFHPRELRSHEPRSSWVSIDATIPLSDGELVSRKVLYMVRPYGRIVQIVGVGLDDSVSGDLAGDAALKLSRLVANRI